ncbi:MAG: proteasome assembly chaperone family protein [Candidatus Aenigmarchaeota archaeon]|nr:proteasome assembly chaperone family protein [Candidatus Aenigmarchaeota archaeon]
MRFIETTIKILKKVNLKNPIAIEGLPGVGNVGRIAAGYLVSELKMEKFAELYSPYLLPLVILHDTAEVQMLRCDFYYYKNKGNDIIVITGDSQSVSPEGHYIICEKILEFVKKLGANQIITLGGYANPSPGEVPRVIGAVNKKALVKKYEKFGINFGNDHPVGTIVGASGLLAGMAEFYGMDAVVLMGETLGLPMIIDPKAADSMLKILKKMLNIDLNLSKLEKNIKEIEKQLNKTEFMHQRMIPKQPPKPASGDESDYYIG